MGSKMEKDFFSGTRHSDVHFFQGIVQVTVPLSKFSNSSFLLPFPTAGTVNCEATRCKPSLLQSNPSKYILRLILFYFTAVLNYLAF